MRKLRIGFLTRSFSPQTKSFVPLVMRALVDAGALVDVVYPVAGVVDLCNVRVAHDLYVLKKFSGLAGSIAGALHAQGAAIVNPYPVTLALHDRIIMSHTLKAAGVPIPDTYVTSHPLELTPLLEKGPLIVKPYRGTDGHGIRVIRSAAELVDMPHDNHPVFAQRYHEPQGRDRKMYSIGGQIFGVKKAFPRQADSEKDDEPFTPAPELCEITRRCGQAFGIDLYGVDIIESGGVPYVVDMNSMPGFKVARDAPLHLARYLYAAAERAARG